jgi:Holin of 3TMs, for gene-transfer release
MADETAEKISASEKKKEDWMNSKWRPMMGWMYMLICTMDMVVFPILWSLLQSLSHGAVNSQWQPLTLQGAGLFHIAMGAVLGIAAHGRTQEKLNGANNGGLGGAGLGTTYVPPGAQNTVNVGGSNNGGFNSSAGGSTAFGAPAAGGFGNSGGFGSPAPAAGGFGGGAGFGAGASGSPTVVTGFGGKPAPVQPQQPML